MADSAADAQNNSGSSPQQLAAAIAAMSTPTTVTSPFGDLDFFDGVPTSQSVKRAYDALDLMRGIDVYLNCLPGASLVAMRKGFRSVGVRSQREIAYTDPRANSGSLYLTANTETTYGTMFLDLGANGPTVIEAPPQSLCVVDDFWFRYVADMGIAGPDQGAGGKYLFLPPGYDGEVPEGYFVYRSRTFSNWVVLRALGGVPSLKTTKVYRLAEADTAPAIEFINIAAMTLNTVHANDFSFFEELNELVQEEPIEALDPERAGALAAIGIVKGAPFSPDERMRAILDNAAKIAAGLARTLSYRPRDPGAYIYEGSSWKTIFVGGSHEFINNGARLLDARTQFHFLATVITPAMARAQVGAGSAYAYTAEDAAGEPLDGSKTYELLISADAPAKNFWAVDVYDTQTRSLLQTESTPYPALSSLEDSLAANPDGTYTIHFGPTPQEGNTGSWIQTIPGKSWFPMIRLYGPLESWFDQTWKLNEVRLVG